MKHISLRIDEVTLRKLHYVAQYETCSLSGQVMYLIQQSIRDFEKAHGKIEPEDLAQLAANR